MQQLLGLVAVIAALVAGSAQGLVLTKCELKTELEDMLPDMGDEDNMKMPFKMEDILAKIICKIEHTTQFNTSVVTVLEATKPPEPPRPLFPFRPSPFSGAADEGSGSVGEGDMEPEKPDHPVSPPWGQPFGRPWSPPRRGKRAVRGKYPPPMKGSFPGGPWGPPPQESEQDPEVVEEEVEEDTNSWTLYGLFQLADRVVCESKDTPSMNICQMPCSDLIDDDISDDIACLKELKRSHEKMKLDPEQKFMAVAMKAKMMAMMFPRQCGPVVASDYFAQCQ